MAASLPAVPVSVVFPIGAFPADVEDVQAAVSLGGRVLLKATHIAGQPTAFDFGDFSGSPLPITNDEFVGSGGLFVTTDVEIVGETLDGARTTIVGGRNPWDINGLYPVMVERTLNVHDAPKTKELPLSVEHSPVRNVTVERKSPGAYG